MMPVAKIMALYRKHTGKEYLEVSGVPEDLDITASRTGNTYQQGSSIHVNHFDGHTAPRNCHRNGYTCNDHLLLHACYNPLL